ncbi:DUF1302 family protein [Deefgea rivuli]|uniref:DUF1302 family protein n=1 Tax=Deefgea rivuli TaxID=400948 RepID=UPI000488305D|nr:DUF1302 family protein [Deefgea rivuli]
MQIRYLLKLGCITMLFHSFPIFAQGMPFGECRAGYWSSNRNLDDNGSLSKATCFVNWRPSLGESIRLGVNARLGAHDAGDGEGINGRLRESFLEIESGALTWRVGRQIIAWGRSDRINPTDNLSPRDLTLLVPDDDEQRNGINAALVRYNLTHSRSITAIVAQFEANKVPQGSLPKSLIRATKPSRPELALKLDQSGGGIDWSISYFDGFDSFGRYRIDFAQPTKPMFHSTYERAQILGTDFAWAQGAWTMRGEFSYSHFEQSCTTCELSRRKVTRAVLGVDRDFGETANINAQLFSVVRNSYQDPRWVPAVRKPYSLALDRLNSEFAAQEWGTTFRISNRVLNDRLKLELAAIVDITNQSLVLRPRANYAFNDSIKLGVGADHFHGDNQTFFGSKKKNNTAFVELSLVY